MLTVDTTPRPHETIEDVFFGEDGPYTFTAGPMPDLLSAYLSDDEDEQTTLIIKGKYNWVLNGLDDEAREEIDTDEEGSPILGPTDREHIAARLADPDDLLQSKHILQMYELLVAEVAKVPPTSRSGSSSTPPRGTGAAKPKRKAATSGA